MTNGIHHITCIASDAQHTIGFYSQILGLRLVKKTVNQDDTQTYHLFFGDRYGHPGMDLTFFIFLPSMVGKQGNGLVTKISLAIPYKSIEFWERRFTKLGVRHETPTVRLEHTRMMFYDFDDLPLELVEIPLDEMDEFHEPWKHAGIPSDHTIRYFHSASLSVTESESSDIILKKVFGYQKKTVEDRTFLYTVSDSKRGNMLEVIEKPSLRNGFNAAGTVHHIAFRAKNKEEQWEMRERVISLGLRPTEVIDRFYFQSVYFRTPAGILFEIATDGPGFTADESEEELGKKLALPPFLESQRNIIEQNLIPLNTNT